MSIRKLKKRLNKEGYTSFRCMTLLMSRFYNSCKGVKFRHVNYARQRYEEDRYQGL